MDGALAIDVGRVGGPRGFPVGLAGSGVLHAAFVAALLLAVPVHNFVEPPEPRPISVELIPAGIFDAAEPAVAPSLPAAVEPEAPAEIAAPTAPKQPAPPPDRTFRATTLYTADLLKTAAMAQVRRSLPTLDRSERVVQLCNIEALEQIRRAAPDYEPDTLVGYAMSDPMMAGLTLTALGGAFRSRRQWYEIAFECTAGPNLDGVTAFSFKLGAAIPETEWEAHNLNAEDKVE
jgi:hypothetical protein